MAVLNNQKSFEQSLRSASPYAPLLRPIKSEIHKGCTGKAHGCGTRKNSRSTLSSLSDSSSEISPVHSEDVPLSREKRPVKRTQSFNGPRDRSSTPTTTKQLNGKAAGSDSKPPWHNVYTAKLGALKAGDSDKFVLHHERNKKKAARRNGVHWHELYERSMDQKLYGGTYLRLSPSQTEEQSAAHDQVKLTEHAPTPVQSYLFIFSRHVNWIGLGPISYREEY